MDLIEDRGFALESMVVLEQTDSTELRDLLQENFRARLKPDDSVVGFVNEATDAGIPVVVLASIVNIVVAVALLFKVAGDFASIT